LVTLQPSGVDVACRVAGQHAGQGEGEWHPFVDGDEVYVMVPEGDEASGGVIVGRLGQGRDTFPTMVAGNDPTLNNFAFKRVLPPYVLESGTALLFRVTTHGAFFSMDAVGGITFQEGAGHYLALHDDQLTLSTQDTSCMLQVDANAKTMFLQAGGTQLFLDSAGNSAFATAGTLALSTAGSPGQWHDTSIEAVTNILVAWGTILTALGATPLTGASLGAQLSPALVGAILAAAALLPNTAIQSYVNAALQSGSTATPNVGSPGLLI
jgi:hypothetical protein